MASASSLDRPPRGRAPVKLVIAGGLGVGKTTAVAAISEIPPVNTDNWMTEAGQGHDAPVTGTKTTTTVAMDFGRIALAEDLMLYLFGTPGQPRFWPLWDDLCRGASGALVLVDTRRLEDSFPAVNYFDADAEVPFVVAVNRFNGVQTHSLSQVRQALRLPAQVPLTTLDARDRTSVARALTTTVTHTLAVTRHRFDAVRAEALGAP
jgi:signal recognition particle receptor subunit beta